MPDATDAETVADAAVTNATEGVASATVDGRSSTAMDPIKQLDVADRIAGRSSLTGNKSAWNKTRPAVSIRPGAV